MEDAAVPTDPTDPTDDGGFAEFLGWLEGRDEHRGDGESPEEVLLAAPELARVDVTDVALDGPRGPVPARRYLPEGGLAAVRSACVWVHGGAFVMGTLDMAESHAVGLTLAHRGVAVVALDYRKAVRGVRHPVPLDDVAAGWAWTVAHADELGVRPEDLHLGGASAGGALAAALALRLRDGAAPLPRSLVLAYTSVHGEPVVDEAEMTRLREVAEPGTLFEVGFMRAAVANYAGEAVRDPYAFAAHGDPAGLPPMLLLTCELDSLRFSAEAWADDVARAGGSVVLERLDGATHGVLDRPSTPHGRAMLDRIGSWLLERPRRP